MTKRKHHQFNDERQHEQQTNIAIDDLIKEKLWRSIYSLQSSRSFRGNNDGHRAYRENYEPVIDVVKMTPIEILNSKYQGDDEGHNMFGLTPLPYLIRYRYNPFVLKTMISKGCDAAYVTKDGGTIFHDLIKYSTFDVMRWLLKFWKKQFVSPQIISQLINTPDLAGNTPLMLAITRPHLGFFNLVLECGADTNTPTPSHEGCNHFGCLITPLQMAACQVGTTVHKIHGRMVEELLDHGADPIQNTTSYTAVEEVLANYEAQKARGVPYNRRNDILAESARIVESLVRSGVTLEDVFSGPHASTLREFIKYAEERTIAFPHLITLF